MADVRGGPGRIRFSLVNGGAREIAGPRWVLNP